MNGVKYGYNSCMFLMHGRSLMKYFLFRCLASTINYAMSHLYMYVVHTICEHLYMYQERKIEISILQTGVVQ